MNGRGEREEATKNWQSKSIDWNQVQPQPGRDPDWPIGSVLRHASHAARQERFEKWSSKVDSSSASARGRRSEAFDGKTRTNRRPITN